MGDVVCSGVCDDLLGDGFSVLGLKQALLRMTVLPEHGGGVGLGVIKLGSQCQCCDASQREFCVYAEECGKEMAVAICS